MHSISAQSPAAAAGLSTAKLREAFLLQGLFASGEAKLRWWETDRTVIGGICPEQSPIELGAPEALRAGYFFERREAGIINLGGPGRIEVDGQSHDLANLDGLYIGRGVKAVSFSSGSATEPSLFYLLSYPAHQAFPTRQVAFKEIKGDRLGSVQTANDRTIYKYFHPGAFPTCQLVMGITLLQFGSVWNTMPPHTHLRRSEVYLYFNVPPDAAVLHVMGEPQETRHLFVRDLEAVLSPPWSIHCGSGTASYSFVWGMGGENQAFTDMDPAPLAGLR